MEEHPFYIEVLRERDNAVLCYCRASEDCPNRNRAFEKRVDMIRHLETYDVHINIPKRPCGRPKDRQKSSLPTSSRSSRQCKIRFNNVDLKIKNARKRHIKDVTLSAPNAWESERSRNKTDLPYDEWLEPHIKSEMDKWEKGMPHRIAKIQRHITIGYEVSRRKRLDGGDEGSNEEHGEPKERDEGPKKEDVETREENHANVTPTSFGFVDAHSPMAPRKAPRSETTHSFFPIKDGWQPNFVAKSKTSTPIQINSPTESSVGKDVYIIVA